jgi:hypothetical protein
VNKSQERRERNKDALMLWVVPVQLEKANEYVENVHRQHFATPMGRWAIACVDTTGYVHGVVIIGNVLARAFDDGLAAEVLRCCTDGTPNAPSILYAAAWKAVKFMGFRHMYTYTLGPEFNENGASLKSLKDMGWVLEDSAAGGAPWNHKSRSTKTGEKLPPGLKKLRWAIHAQDPFPIEEIRWPVFVNPSESPIETLWGDPVIVGQKDELQQVKKARVKIAQRSKNI